MHESESEVKSLSRVRLLATPWTAAYQAPPSMGFARQEYWSGVPLPSPTRGHSTPKWRKLETGFRVVINGRTQDYVSVIHWSEKAMAPHSSTLAWKIPWTEEPGRLQSMGSLRVGHDWGTSISLSRSCIGEGNANPLQCSCLENPRDGGAWWAAIYGVAQSWTQLKWLSSIYWYLFLGEIRNVS